MPVTSSSGRLYNSPGRHQQQELPRLGEREIFQDHVLATATLDRLLDHATTLNIKSESYRLKEKRRAGLLGQAPQPPTRGRDDRQLTARNRDPKVTGSGDRAFLDGVAALRAETEVNPEAA